MDFKNDFYIDPNLDVKTIKTIANSDYRIELKSFDQEKRSGAKVLKNPQKWQVAHLGSFFQTFALFKKFYGDCIFRINFFNKLNFKSEYN